jgi:hypothetical protein
MYASEDKLSEGGRDDIQNEGQDRRASGPPRGEESESEKAMAMGRRGE